jgi:hypothetical protein
MTKIKPDTWSSLPRNSKLASCLWPALVPDNIKAEMQVLSRNEGKRSPLDASGFRSSGAVKKDAFKLRWSR